MGPDDDGLVGRRPLGLADGHDVLHLDLSALEIDLADDPPAVERTASRGRPGVDLLFHGGQIGSRDGLEHAVDDRAAAVDDGEGPACVVAAGPVEREHRVLRGPDLVTPRGDLAGEIVDFLALGFDLLQREFGALFGLGIARGGEEAAQQGIGSRRWEPS